MANPENLANVADFAWTPANNVRPEEYLSEIGEFRDLLIQNDTRIYAIEVKPFVTPPLVDSEADTQAAELSFGIKLTSVNARSKSDNQEHGTIIFHTQGGILWPSDGRNTFTINRRRYISQQSTVPKNKIYWDRIREYDNPDEPTTLQDVQVCTMVVNRNRYEFSVNTNPELEKPNLELAVITAGSNYTQKRTTPAGIMQLLNTPEGLESIYSNNVISETLEEITGKPGKLDETSLAKIQELLQDPENPHCTTEASLRDLSAMRIWTPITTMGNMLEDQSRYIAGISKTLMKSALSRPQEEINQGNLDDSLEDLQQILTAQGRRITRIANNRFRDISAMDLVNEKNPNVDFRATRIKLYFGAFYRNGDFATDPNRLLQGNSIYSASDDGFTVNINCPLKRDEGNWVFDLDSPQSERFQAEYSIMLAQANSGSGRALQANKMIGQAVPFSPGSFFDTTRSYGSISTQDDGTSTADYQIQAPARIAYMSHGPFTHEDAAVVSQEWARENPIVETTEERIECIDKEEETLFEYNVWDYVRQDELRNSLSHEDLNFLLDFLDNQDRSAPLQERDRYGWLEPGEPILGTDDTHEEYGASILGFLFETQTDPESGNLKTVMHRITSSYDCEMGQIAYPDIEKGNFYLEAEKTRIRPLGKGDKITTITGSKCVISEVLSEAKMPQILQENGQIRENNSAVEVIVNAASQASRMITSGINDAAIVSAGRRKLSEIIEMAQNENTVHPETDKILAYYLPGREKAVEVIYAGMEPPGIFEDSKSKWPWDTHGDNINIQIEAYANNYQDIQNTLTEEVKVTNMLEFLKSPDLVNLRFRYGPSNLGQKAQEKIMEDLGVAEEDGIETLRISVDGEEREIETICVNSSIAALHHFPIPKRSINSNTGNTLYDAHGKPIRDLKNPNQYPTNPNREYGMGRSTIRWSQRAFKLSRQNQHRRGVDSSRSAMHGRIRV